MASLSPWKTPAERYVGGCSGLALVRLVGKLRNRVKSIFLFEFIEEFF